MMWDGGDGGWGWGSWLLMSLMMLVFFALVAWGAVLLWRSTQGTRGSGPPPTSETSEAILGERLARGEIDAEEYRERLEALRGTPPAPSQR
jgi:putative membrane protein